MKILTSVCIFLATLTVFSVLGGIFKCLFNEPKAGVILIVLGFLLGIISVTLGQLQDFFLRRPKSDE